nr:hypothetical protein [Tanacetum cinerariifolium]
MEAGGKDRPPMLALGNYIQYESRIQRYIDTKPTNELIHYCLTNLPHIFTWVKQTVLVLEGSSETRTKGYMETYKNVSQDIQHQLYAKAQAVQIILKGIDNDIYSTVDDCPNSCEMWKAIERSTNLPTTTLELHQSPVEQIRIILQESIEAHGMIIKGLLMLPELVRMQRKLNEKMLLCKQKEVEFQLNVEQADWRPIFDAEPLQKVQTDNDNYNMFANVREHLEQPETVNDTCLDNKLIEIILFIVDSGCSKQTRNLKLLSSRGTDLYSITFQDTSTPNIIRLRAKASSSQVWLWCRRLLHLNFDTINLLSKYNIVTGLPKLKFVKDHLCSSRESGKAKQEMKVTMVLLDLWWGWCSVLLLQRWWGREGEGGFGGDVRRW